MTETLFTRLGGIEGIHRIASDLVDAHMANTLINKRFAGSNVLSLKKLAAEFFIAGSGGPADAYKGKDMLSAHRHMNISDNEFMAAVDDLMFAMTKNGLGDTEKAEALYIFYQLRPNVVGV
jgi:hemoglobin